MTHKARKSSTIASRSSSIDASRHKHRHRTFKEPIYDDYSDPSVSQSEEEAEENGRKPTTNNAQIDEDEGYTTESESLNNLPITSDPFFSPIPESNPIVSDNFSSHLASNSPVAYINIAPIPVFRGNSDECPVSHLSRFAKVCRANGASSIEMMMRIFPVTLENEASLWYDLNIEPYSLTWEEIKASFVEAYSKIDLADGLQSELMMINQGEDESVRSYFLRLQWILKKWSNHGLSEDLIKGIFVDGLRGDFHDWILSQKPSSLNDALRQAFNWEQVRCIRGARRNASECGFCSGEHEEGECEIRERMRELWLSNKEKGSGIAMSESGKNEAAEESRQGRD